MLGRLGTRAGAAWPGAAGAGATTRREGSAPLFDGPPVVVSVVDGDTGAPVAGVEVSGLRGGAVIARATSDAAGRTTLPLGVGVVTADPRPYSPARVRVRDGRGRGGPVRPAPPEPPVRRRAGARPLRAGRGARGPRAAARHGRFASRTLLEFPPAVRDGLVVIGNNAGRVYALDAGDGRAALGAPAARRDRLDPGHHPGRRLHVLDGRLPRALRPGGHPVVDLLQLRQPHRELAAGGGRPGLRGGARRAPLRRRRADGAGALDLPGARRRSRAAPRGPAASWWWATTRDGSTPWTPGPAPSGGPTPAACGSTGDPG